MSYTPRLMAEEHLVRKDENGYSLDHALVSDLNRSLIQEMVETAKLLQRIRAEEKLKREGYQTQRDEITTKDIERLLSYEIKKKEMNEKSNTETRKLIDYSDVLI